MDPKSTTPTPKDDDPGKENPPAEGGAAAANAEEDPKDDDPEGDVKDKHGHPGISEGKYKRDMEAKDAEISELKAQVAKAAETKEGREKLEKRIAELEEKQADERLAHKLEMTGCKSVKAAKALLEDVDGDVAKLKAEYPYLFEQEKQKGSTGGKPDGAPNALDEKLDKAFGLKK